ncbi:MAG: sigma-54 interaction domain-containing protein [Candidatus Aminicenantales bacterium]
MDKSSSKTGTESSLNMLIVAGHPSLHQAIKKSPIDRNWNILWCRPEEDVLTKVKEHEIQVLVIQMEKHKREAAFLLQRLKTFDPIIDVILIGAPLSPEAVVGWINRGATDYLLLPLEIKILEKALRKISKKRALRKETYRLERKLEKKYLFHGMIGKSPHMLEVFSLIENIAEYFSSVLVTGETGSGKELAARAIHHLSQTENKKFVICDCVSIPENLFESELFGYVKGAFTGADRDKKGLFEEADGGIIFLDEIGEIPLSVQAKLLRVLEQRQFRPLGSNKNRRVDVRVIAATSRDLREATKAGLFREDLFHRLNKVEIHLPPLRKRPEDIPLLVRHFLERYSKKFNKDLKGISRRVQKLFLHYRWPGNIRELENVLERASMLCPKQFIDIDDLPPYLQRLSPSDYQIPFIDREHLSTLDDLEKEYITYILKKTGYNLKRTAKILNISRTTLYTKIKKYNISRSTV